MAHSATIWKLIIVRITLVLLGIVHLGAPSVGQVQHNQIRSDLPPGLAAQRYRKADTSLGMVTQPVRIITPEETSVSLLSNGSVLTTAPSSITVGLAIGPVYQLKVSGIRLHESVKLYPSIELLGRLYPPKGLENRFPVEIVITRDDLIEVIDGGMVTKVIYLEHGDMVIPHKHSPDTQPSFDVSAGEDPLRASQSLGRPMAIVRIGSRVPLNGNLTDAIQTIGPPPVLLSEPVTMSLSDQINSPAPPQKTLQQPPSNLPPIVTRNRSARDIRGVQSHYIRN